MFVLERAYVYLLGLYLGDGTITGTGRCFQLRLTLDARYPEIVAAAAGAVSAVVPHGRVHERARAGARVLYSGWKDWPEACRSGPGKKHMRRITLAGWQRALVDEHPREPEPAKYQRVASA